MAASAMTTPAIMAPKSLRTNIPLTGHSITLTGQLFSLPTTTDSLREAPTATGCFLFPARITTAQTLTNTGETLTEKERNHRACKHFRASLLVPRHPVTDDDIP